MTYDGQNLRLYLDGSPDGAPEPFILGPGYNDGDPLFIGTREFGPCCKHLFQGLIDEVEIFDRALDPSEIKALYLAGSAGKCRKTFQYAAKFVCGRTPDSGPVALGFYFTAINVHNPDIKLEVKLSKKFAVALPGEKVGPISKFHDQTLKADEAMEIDCPDILKHLEIPQGQFVKGFAVIQSSRELDVVSVYTTAASPAGTVITMTLERVPKRGP